MINIGVLALQGNYNCHKTILKSFDVGIKFVKYSEDLDACNGLIIPGGESTAISIQINRNKLKDAIINFSNEKPILGTCAGMIMLSSKLNSNNVDTLGIMDFDIDRNAWGRQVNSFTDKVKLSFDSRFLFEGVFIRAPKIKRIGSKIEIIAKYKTEPVMVSDGRHVACSFHPELGIDNRIHSYFMEKIND